MLMVPTGDRLDATPPAPSLMLTLMLEAALDL